MHLNRKTGNSIPMILWEFSSLSRVTHKSSGPSVLWWPLRPIVSTCVWVLDEGGTVYYMLSLEQNLC